LGGILVSVGFFMSGHAHSLTSLYIWFGVVGGLGNGFGYCTPIPVMAKWFPDKRGLAVGLAVAGYGGGSAIFGKLALNYLIPHFSTPGTTDGWRATFMTLGVIFFAHGAQKVFGWFGGPGLKGTIGYFRQALHIPPTLTVLDALIECFGGLAVVVGLLSRPAALGLIVVTLVAISKVHWPNGFFMNWELAPGKGHGIEMNLALLGLALAVLVGGAGALSVDRLIAPW
jgi:putative oxidoreductase